MVKATEILLVIEMSERTMYTRSPKTVKLGGNGPVWRFLTAL